MNSPKIQGKSSSNNQLRVTWPLLPHRLRSSPHGLSATLDNSHTSFQLRNGDPVSEAIRNGVGTLTYTTASLLLNLQSLWGLVFVLCFDFAFRPHWNHCHAELASCLLDLLLRRVSRCRTARWAPIWYHFSNYKWGILKEEILIRDTKTTFC